MHGAEYFPQEEHEKRQDQEEYRVLHGPFRLLVDVHRLDKADAKRRSVHAIEQRITAVFEIGTEPASRERPAELGHAPTRGEATRGFGGAFTGLIDDLRLYDRALSASEIATGQAPTTLRPPTNIRIIR